MKESKINKCPLCNNNGQLVENVTVKHLVADEYGNTVQGKKYKICLNENCNVVYFDVDNGNILLKNQIKVPIWFKKDANPKYACYCSKVTQEQIKDAVINHKVNTIKEVVELTGAMKNANCKKNNPLGVCCHNIIQEILDKVK